MVAQYAVVCYVAVCHDKACVAHYGLFFAGCTTVYGNELTQDGVVADDGVGFFALIFQVLWQTTDHCSLEDVAVFAYCGVGANGCVILYDSTFSYLNIFLDAYKGSNVYGRMNFRVGVHKG
jgi:hypothetical protein